MGRAAAKNGRTAAKSWKVCAPEGQGQAFSLWNEQIYIVGKGKKAFDGVLKQTVDNLTAVHHQCIGVEIERKDSVNS